MSAALDITVERLHGSAADLHHLPAAAPHGGLHLRWFDVDGPAIVLGSAQAEAALDVAACARLGVQVVRRRSGGGAVLLRPGEQAWFDLTVPRAHPSWHDDVGIAPQWVGAAVARALQPQFTEPLVVHHGGMVHGPWSRLVCFAGIGPGEVVVGPRPLAQTVGCKVAGVSQRRTREAATFQVAVYRHWAARDLAALLAPPAPTAADLDALVATADLDLDVLVTALTRG